MGSRPVVVHPGPMDTDLATHAEPGTAARHELRVATRDMPGDDAVLAGAVLAGERWRPGLQGARATRVDDLRPVRRRQNGAEGQRKPVQPANWHESRRPRQPEWRVV